MGDIRYLSSKINYEKSIKAGRLIHRVSITVVFDYFFFFFSAFAFMGVLTIPAIIKPVDISDIFIWYLLFVILIDCWMLINIFLTNVLIKIEPAKTALKKDDIAVVLKAFFPNVYLNHYGTNLLSYRNPSGFLPFQFGRDITILREADLLYINITGLGRGESASPFHGWSGYCKCKQIAKAFEAL